MASTTAASAPLSSLRFSSRASFASISFSCALNSAASAFASALFAFVDAFCTRLCSASRDLRRSLVFMAQMGSPPSASSAARAAVSIACALSSSSSRSRYAFLPASVPESRLTSSTFSASRTVLLASASLLVASAAARVFSSDSFFTVLSCIVRSTASDDFSVTRRSAAFTAS